MLNIPEEIKQLFRQGSVKKNLRIHFPNGEREDITNNNIISESFSFTESVMSQSELKFGLCEASMVEFECFDIGYIKGFEIEVTLEIWDGNTFFPIPMGTYIVDSCNRQADRNRRKVVAYTSDFGVRFKISEFEKLKQSCYSRTKSPYKYKLIPYLYNNINGLSDEFITQKTLVESGEEVELYRLNVTDKEGTKRLAARVYFFGKAYHFYYNKEYDYQEMPGVKISPDKLYNYAISKSSGIYMAFSELEALYRMYDVTFMNQVNGSLHDLGFSEKVKEYLKKPHIYMQQYIKVTNSHWIEKEDFFSQIKDVYSTDEGDFYFYPEIDNFENKASDNAYMYFFIPTRMKVDYYVDGEFWTSADYGMYEGDLFECDVIEYLNPVQKIDRSVVENIDFILLYKVEKESNLNELLEPFLELNGRFGRVGRDGKFKMVSINSDFGLYPSETLYPANDLYPITTNNFIGKSTYKSAWYDDEYTRLYHKVTCTYKDSSTQEETYAEYIMLNVDESEEDKYQVYDISDNYLIKENTFTMEQIMQILANLGNNIGNVQYMPAEVDLIGLPYMEAGDVVQVLTTEGGFETIVLNRTLTGIQSLSDNFDSRG